MGKLKTELEGCLLRGQNWLVRKREGRRKREGFEKPTMPRSAARGLRLLPPPSRDGGIRRRKGAGAERNA